MNDIAKLAADPAFWFVNYLVPVFAILTAHLVKTYATTRWLSYLLFLNSAVLTYLILAGYVVGDYPWFLETGTGLLAIIFIAVSALLPSPLLRAFVLLALNVPAAWIALKLYWVDLPSKWESYAYAYVMVGMVIGLVAQALAMLTYGRSLHDAIDEGFSRLFRASGQKTDPEVTSS